MVKFNKIENAEIFTRDFRPLVKNCEVAFSRNEGIAVIYGPNGTGKSSLMKVLSGSAGTKVEFEYDGATYDSGETIFHTINDQNNRNIIKGTTKDFFIGDDIKREFELQEFIATERTKTIETIGSILKSNFGISAANSPLIDLVTIQDIASLIKDIANNKSKGKNYSTEDIIVQLQSIVPVDIAEYDEQKLNFLKIDYAAKDSLIKKIEQLSLDPIVSNPHVHEIEENTEAITILNRFHKEQCIVCDTEGIDREALIVAKSLNRDSVIEALDDAVKALIEKIIELVPSNDPFKIKHLLVDAISKGDNGSVLGLLDEIRAYKGIYCQSLLNSLATLLSESELPSKMVEYQALLDEAPEITEEDMIYIKEIISNSMGKSLTLERDGKKNLKIRLSDIEFLEKARDELPLSTGEQNFLSLTFEFLKAKNSLSPIVVIDDPISSFDSIYKNKVVYAIVKMLQHKKRIVLTHNIDLLRLLESQYKNCYRLYLLNNTDGEENGFIPIAYNEQEMLINLEKLLLAFREKIFDHIQDVELFLIAMIPFMRGYCNIINNTELSNKLTQLMHGYKTESIDVAQIYIELFGNKDGVIPDTYEISVSDILRKTVDSAHIVNNEQYPLLDKTLKHSFTYLFLRLMVEKELVAKFSIDTNKYKQLGQIISQAYPNETDLSQVRDRIRLTSKKTLINEFNHFEGNLSIFQPAIDITDHTLGTERTDIVAFVSSLC